jgi:antitoxin (DNA-binding transcriptional repressor) of toxin-antitoxin stability system
MRVTASQLRENIYGLLDQVIATGEPIEVIHKGTLLKIVPERPSSKLSRLPKRKGFKGNPGDIVHMDWLKEWSALK